tara:strand:+ start:2284 stop:2664 length:381 start_codon:yes stop_codon:yes gene_type:complete
MANYSDVLRQYYSSSKWILRIDGNDQDSYDSLEWLDSSTKPTKAKLDSYLSSVETEEMLVFRQMRNKKLLESDWTRIDDCGISTSKKAEWATYRQELRDITKTVTPVFITRGIIDESKFSWPTKPS